MADELFPDQQVLTTKNCPNGHPVEITYGRKSRGDVPGVQGQDPDDGRPGPHAEGH